VAHRDRDMFLGEIEKIVSSRVLHGSESLCKMLRYLAEHAVDHPGASLKEYQIATEVFGRPADFDPQSDSTIRVQAGRLRQKLAEYYAGEGAEDQIIVDLPKGSYGVSFHHRTPVLAKPVSRPWQEPGRGEASRGVARKWIVAVMVLSVLLIAAVIVIASLLETQNVGKASPAVDSEPVPAAFRVFWNGLFSGTEGPWVIFSNAGFVGRPETGMRYFDAAHDTRPGVILDHYTGVGEVLAVHDLDYVFGLLHRRIRVKRGSLFSLDDVKNNDLIFVGSPAENLTLREIPNTQEFVFQRLISGPRKGDLAVTNVHPQPNEPTTFLASPSPQPLTEDYAVIGFLKGLDPARSVLILAGTTTMGTQAAAEYVCSPNSVQELLQRLSVSNTGELKPFEAVLRVKVTRGVPVETQLVALRKSTP
jgi:hypothetical protein